MGGDALVAEPRPACCRLPQRKLKPFKQGQLDCLCGLYAAINAVRLQLAVQRPLRRREAKQLFDRGVSFLSGRRALAVASLAGSGPELWYELLAAVLTKVWKITGQRLRVVRPFVDDLLPTRDVVFATIETAICAGQPVLIHLASGWDHFTVVSGYTSARLDLFDSGALDQLLRAACTNDGERETRTAVINARCLTLLEPVGG